MIAFHRPTSLGYLAVVRIFIGVHFLIVALPKITGMTADSLASQLMRTAPDDPLPFHREFILGFVVPNADVFSRVIAFEEVAIGLSLITGCLVRVSSAFGIFQNLNILFAIAIPNGGGQIGTNLTFIAAQLMFIFAGAGRSLGIDAILKRMFPRSPWF